MRPIVKVPAQAQAKEEKSIACLIRQAGVSQQQAVR